MLKKLFDFFVFSSLFIAVCAVVMAYQTYYLFHIPLLYPFFGFLFFGTLCSYNFHWYLTPEVQSLSRKVQWAQMYKWVHIALCIAGGIGAAYFLFQLRQHWFWLLVSSFITFLYSAPKVPYYPFLLLRKIAVGKTMFLAFVWMHTTTLLPLLISDVPFTAAPVLFSINRFFFLYAICIVFDFRDREQDKTEGIKSLITALNERAIDRIFWGSMVIFFLTTSCLSFYHFSIGDLTALLVPGIILALLYYPSKKSISDYLYYFVLDGLMMLSALILLVIHF